jgi:hypothetical protein
VGEKVYGEQMNEIKAFPHCPKCGTTLQQVEYSGGMLNEDQWRSTRAGDWFCVTCKSDKARTGYLYFWNRELMTPMARGQQDAKEVRDMLDSRYGSPDVSQIKILTDALLAIANFPVYSERIGAALAMQDIAENGLKAAASEPGRREGEMKLENAVSERDAAEEFASQIYFIITGHSPEWSNTFGFEQAAQEIEEAINLLKQAAKPQKLFPQV